MNVVAIYALLLVAALLEAGGDAIVRLGLHQHDLKRVSAFACGAIILFAYGVTVNSPPWDFGRLLGVYVSLFFLVAQVLSFALFGTRPDLPIIVGGTLIVVGGIVMTFWRV